MQKEETPAEYKDKFLLSFVEMGWADSTMVDPRYKDWTSGRVEIHTYESEYAIDEKHFCTPDAKEWREFKKVYDLEWIAKDELDNFVTILKEKFYRVDENYNPVL